MARARPRPLLYVLAGVNGAGKSSVGGQLLGNEGLDWFNPDTFGRDLIRAAGCDQETANARAWKEGVRRLEDALARRDAYAFETTLGGTTVAAMIRDATESHDVMIWFCGLDSPEHHIARVRMRVAGGGHDIPESRIRERYPRALRNLIDLMPHLARLRVYDNSHDVAAGAPIPDPVRVLDMDDVRITWPAPDGVEALGRTPEWAKPLVEAALERGPGLPSRSS